MLISSKSWMRLRECFKNLSLLPLVNNFSFYWLSIFSRSLNHHFLFSNEKLPPRSISIFFFHDFPKRGEKSCTKVHICMTSNLLIILNQSRLIIPNSFLKKLDLFSWKGLVKITANWLSIFIKFKSMSLL